MKLYVAFGSNLNKRQMRRRCPGAVPKGKFMLTKAKLVFRGVADVEYSPNDSVPCGLWMIDRQDEAALDRYEGVATGSYYKEESIVLKYQGKAHNALIYLKNDDGIYPPSQAYLDTIKQGYKDFGLDEAYLDEAVKQAFLNKQPNDLTRERRWRQRQTEQHRSLAAMPESVALKRLDQKLQ